MRDLSAFSRDEFSIRGLPPLSVDGLSIRLVADALSICGLLGSSAEEASICGASSGDEFLVLVCWLRLAMSFRFAF